MRSDQNETGIDWRDQRPTKPPHHGGVQENSSIRKRLTNFLAKTEGRLSLKGLERSYANPGHRKPEKSSSPSSGNPLLATH